MHVKSCDAVNVVAASTQVPLPKVAHFRRFAFFDKNSRVIDGLELMNGLDGWRRFISCTLPIEFLYIYQFAIVLQVAGNPGHFACLAM